MRTPEFDADVRPLSRLLKALADESRLKIVALLAHSELCVCHIVRALGISQPNASRHLAVLKSAGAVLTRRRGNWIYYRLAPQPDAESRRILSALTGSFGRRDRIRREVNRVVRGCGPGCV
jgi:ArsR family transcriptional regulator